MIRPEQYRRVLSRIAPTAKSQGTVSQGTVRLSTRVLLVVFPLAVVVLSVPPYQTLGAFPVLRGAWLAALVAVVLYGTAHVLRAARLALLAAPALNLRARTVVLLHFHAAPVSFIVPFKLGELYRWQQLAWLSRNPGGALLIVLLDRMLDALVLLLALAAVAGLSGRMAAGTAVISALLTLATVLGLFVVLVVPGCLETLQAYILQNHSAPRARRVLRVVDASRLAINSAKERLQGNFILLLFISALIWIIESGMLVLLAHQVSGSGSFPLSLLTRTLFPQVADGTAPQIISLYVLVCLLTLLPLWVVATVLYLPRVHAPRRKAPLLRQSFSARRTRRLHLRVTAKTL